MNRNENIKKITAETGSNWLEETEKKLANKGARKNARKLALQVLRLLREQNITQTELAERMGVSRQQVSKIVKGQENFSFETVDKLEKALGVTMMTIGTPPEMVYHLPNLAMGISMLYYSHLTYTLFENHAMGIVDQWNLDFYTAKMSAMHQVPLAWPRDILHLPLHRFTATDHMQQIVSWRSADVLLDTTEIISQHSQPFRISDSEIVEYCMS